MTLRKQKSIIFALIIPKIADHNTANTIPIILTDVNDITIYILYYIIDF